MLLFPSSSVGDTSFWSPPRGFSNLSKPIRTFLKPSTTFPKLLGISRTTSNQLRRFFDFFRSCEFLIEVARFRTSFGYIGAIGTPPIPFEAFRTIVFHFSAFYCIINLQFRTSLILIENHSFRLFLYALYSHWSLLVRLRTLPHRFASFPAVFSIPKASNFDSTRFR